MFALLSHITNGTFSRERFLDMDDWELLNVLSRPDFHANQPERGYWPVPRSDPDDKGGVKQIGLRGSWFHPKRIKAMKTLGMTDEEIEAGFQAWRATFH